MVRKTETGMATRNKMGVNSWEEEMMKDAEVAASQEATNGGGQFLGLGSGVLSYNGAPMPNNELRCVILDAIFENVYYEGDYDRDNPSAPRCFAFARYDGASRSVVGIDTHEGTSEMAPHKTVTSPMCETCDKCPKNQFGTAKTGRGKACKNTRRLALIPVQGSTKKGQFIIDANDTDHYSQATIAYLKTPVTSTKIYSAYVQSLSSSVKRPPYGVFTRLYLQPSADSQFTVNYEAIDNIPASLGKIIMDRHNEAMSAITFPYALYVEDSPAPAEKGKTKGKSAVKQPTAPAKGRRY